MHFSRLILSGFKSFVDKVDLDILPGITGIVGPNGCGKSNLLEALRWVIGETSYKSMRATHMDDVIFSGTQRRPPYNHAEVCLVLDNTKRTIATEYNDTDIVEIKRRIERETGSTYQVNGKEVRARNVQLIFADASIGTQSFSFVKQGQVNDIINAKPENRSKILEEASGVSGLYARRHEAELRLSATKRNLEKGDETSKMLITQLSALKRQARQAQKYKKLSDQIREIDSLLLHIQLKEASDHLVEARESFNNSDRNVFEYTTKLTAKTHQQLKIQETVSHLRDREASATIELHRFIVERDALKQEELRVHELMTGLTQQLKDMTHDKLREEEQIKDASEQLAKLCSEQEKISLDNVQDNIQIEGHIQKNLEEIREKLLFSEMALDDVNKRFAQYEARSNEVTQSLDQYRVDFEKMMREKDVLVQELKEQLSEGEIKPNISVCQEQLLMACKIEQQVRQEMEVAQDVLSVLRKKYDMLSDTAKKAESVVERLAGEKSVLASMFVQSADNQWSVLREEISVVTGYETALGAVLGKTLEASSDVEAPSYWQYFLPFDRPQSLPDGLRPLSDFVTAPKVLDRRLEQIGVVSFHRGSALQGLLLPGQCLVSQRGDIWRWDGYCSLAESDILVTQRLAQYHRFQNMKDEFSMAQNVAQESKHAYENVRAEIQNASQLYEKHQSSLHQAQETVRNIQKALSELEVRAVKYESQISLLQNAEQRMIQDVTQLQMIILEKEQEGAELQRQQAFFQDIEDKKHNISITRSEFSIAQGKVENFMREQSEKHQKLQQVTQDINNWENRQQHSERQIENFNQRIESVSTEIEKTILMPEQLIQRRDQWGDRIKDVDSQRQDFADTLATTERMQHQLKQEHKNLQMEVSTQRESRAKFEVIVEKAQENLEEIHQNIRKVLQCELEEALSVANHSVHSSLSDMTEMNINLERYRREREMLGAVNLRAVEDVKNIREKLESMQSDRDELAQAIHKLHYVIGKLNREGSARINSAFERVSQHFCDLFSALFEGGTAELKRIESDDPLGIGLEIFVNPPGKKIQTISLLSGGEQTLTALALIFAVFMTNPSPICVLDEVDAALDDANVERFCHMITDIASKTQTRFLIITHHVLTMARVDRLFGVTMQERGVSQLVSVDLQRAQIYAES